MKILITGGSGFIGSHLSHRLIEDGHDVTIIDNFITGNKQNVADILHHERFTLIEADLTTYSLDKLPAFDIIFHLASPASPVQYWKYPVETLRTNAEGTYHVLEHARTHPGTRVVLASTSEVYGDPLVHPQTEDYWGNVNPNGIRSCYDEAKRYAEAICFAYFRTYKIGLRVARIFNTYGPNMEKDDGRVVSNFVTQALKHEPITVYGDGTQTRSLCYVSDMVSALLALSMTDGIDGEVINLGNPNEKTVTQIAELVKDMTQTPSEIVYKEIDADDPKRRKPDITKAKKLLHWEPVVPLEDGLEKTIAYFKTIV